MNDNPKNNILMSENIRQKKTNNSGKFRWIGYNDDKYMHENRLIIMTNASK